MINHYVLLHLSLLHLYIKEGDTPSPLVPPFSPSIIFLTWYQSDGVLHLDLDFPFFALFDLVIALLISFRHGDEMSRHRM